MPEKFDAIAGELGKLGLSKKEASLYLHLLEKGSATVLEISKDTRISRPTIYRTLQELQMRELVFADKEKKKSFFSASSPDSLLRVLKIKKRRVEEQEREFLRIISVLQSKYHLLSNKNEIRSYQKKILLNDFSDTLGKKIYVLYSDNYLEDCGKMEKIYSSIRKRLGRIVIKEIFPRKIKPSKLDYVQRKTFDFPKFSEKTLVISQRVFILEKKEGLCVDEDNVVDFFRFMFKIIWKSEK
jgi:sugar-specific transcriptional regulator TrmB